MGCNFFTEIRKSFIDPPRTNSEHPVRLQHERYNYTMAHKPSDQQMKRNLWESREKTKAYEDILDKKLVLGVRTETRAGLSAQETSIAG